MAKYLRKKKRNKLLFLLFIPVFIIILLACVCLIYFLSKLDKITYADEINDSHHTVDVTLPTGYDISATEPGDPDSVELVIDVGDLQIAEIPPTVPDTDVQKSDEVLNILLIGTDERSTNYSTNARADSMILVSINKDRNTVKLVSLERGIGVPILEGELEGQYDLLTHIFRWGGADLLIKTVEHCFKVDVNHYVRVNFAAVEKIVDAVGGINMEITAKEAEGLNLWAAADDQRVIAGMNRLTGGAALRFARLRWIDSDWQRVKRQRKVILAVVDELKSSNLKELDHLADTVLPLIQTNLTKLEIAELVLYAPNFLKAEFDQMTIPKQGTYGGMGIRNGGGAFAVDYEINNDLLYRFLYEGATSEELLAE